MYFVVLTEPNEIFYLTIKLHMENRPGTLMESFIGKWTERCYCTFFFFFAVGLSQQDMRIIKSKNCIVLS